MKRCVYLFLLSILLVAGLTACGSGKAEQEVPSLTEIEDILDAWGKPGGGLSGLFGDIYDAPTLGGWVIVQYDIPATTSTDTDLNALPVSWVSLPAVS